MGQENFKLRGVRLEPYFQLYKNLDDEDAREGEILTRLESGQSAFEFIAQLDSFEHFLLLEWLIEQSEFLKEEFNLQSSINVDNSAIFSPMGQAQFLRISEKGVPGTTFEFTETNALPPSGEINKLFLGLRQNGHVTALDDFGSGLNGMTMLTDYDFDVVKIDRMLTMDLGQRTAKVKVLSLLFEMLTALNKSHVVEVYESSESFELMANAGYRVFQSFQFYKPVPFSELGQVLIRKVKQ
ncbi:EAL domain-containing protein [Candidatus Aquiluna sp. UB-MaderosW2red]|uniref:EAL domain-containing protein n=1 Tax=Candidatus Aquiluna sp. UB-MaderosW2red TaxID=1855377 RepID=UPI000875E212|nr:EAL domain-containing protein [Candidatus Aquiluna sp. UB-MaderosW2red]SCX14869.1 EAL domain, c-di-GMP-specific phosphodiesterase class I (or its enzymatically inactive variant) [Candidatus Aquiluna sp. UB-MaderosW2red]